MLGRPRIVSPALYRRQSSWRNGLFRTLSTEGNWGALDAPGFWWSKKAKSQLIKLTSEIFSLTALMPTSWPVNTLLQLILRRPMQIPALRDVMVRSAKGFGHIAQAGIWPGGNTVELASRKVGDGQLY